MSGRIVFRADGNAGLGLGHVSRCLLLANALRELDGAAPLSFATAGEHGVIAAAGHELLPLPSAAPLALLPALERSAAGTVVFDLSHRESLARAAEFPPLFEALRARGIRTVLIDGPGEDSLSAAAGGLPADITIVPYVGAGAAGPGRWLTGPEWFILPPEYAQAKEWRDDCRRILVTAGGSDPTAISALALEALALLEEPPEIRVIVGPYFSPELRARLARPGPPRSTLVTAPASLLEHIHWCDLAITATGLTKYELAATGTPALHISLDARHARLNAAFAATGCALDVGAIDGLTPAILLPLIARLCADSPARRAMARRGRSLVDGCGAGRVAAILASSC